MIELSHLLVSCFVVGAAALHAPPKGAITVGGSKGQYANLSEALADNSSLIYFVFPGTYTDTAVIARDNVRVYGQTLLPGTYLGNSQSASFSDRHERMPLRIDFNRRVAGSNDASGTVQVHAMNVSLYNLNIANTYGKPVDQTPGPDSDRDLVYFRDTLLANVGAQYYANSWIEGAVDFTIRDGNITASGRPSDDGFWYGNGTQTYLGRPWRDYARVVYQFCHLGKGVPAVGWQPWHPDDLRIDHVTFAEYGNTGPGADGRRANFSTHLHAPISMHTVLNSTDWIDPAFL
ncbi:carbohydrate esterase family 8 protein [Polyporus arcularius HHB13444]|uniref:pectinesterase n=1 Tax=Polyporus arcularius HHB13444 TaxID=1314778 RepID=A0A5C3PY56_9APHY|nr:carbohydrate esterase family 8 protein [Polyporus arcularius HHB13444]